MGVHQQGEWSLILIPHFDPPRTALSSPICLSNSVSIAAPPLANSISPHPSIPIHNSHAYHGQRFLYFTTLTAHL